MRDHLQIYNQQPRYVTNQLGSLILLVAPTLSGKENKYWSRDYGSALRWEGNHRSSFAPAERHTIYHISTYRLGWTA